MAGPGPGRRSGPPLAGRFAAAIALTVGFYVLALAIAGALLGAAILPWALNGSMAEAPGEVGRLAGALQQREPELAAEYAAALGAALMANGMLAALHERGWSVDALPGQPLLCRRGDDVLAPHAIVDDLRHERLEPDDWRQRAAELRIADVLLEPQRVPATSA